MDKLIKSIIQSTLLEYNYQFLLKELAEQNLKNFTQTKLRIIEKLIRRAVYLKEEHLLYVFKFSKVISSYDKVKEPGNYNDASAKKMHHNHASNQKDMKNDSNFCLDSNPNSRMESNSDWGIEEKGKSIIIIE